MKRRSIIVIYLLFVVAIAFLSASVEPFSKYITASAGETVCRTVIVDAGHGGFDGGAVAVDGTVEKDINLQITLYLCEMLKTSGYRVIVTRQADVSTDDVEGGTIAVRKKSDLKNRLKLMEDYPDAVFVSIHLNKFTTSAARGSQVFYSGKNEESKVLGEAIQNSIKNMLQPDNTRVNKQATSSTYLLYNASIPAVLVECGFLSNKAELEMLKDSAYQLKIAFCCFCGINDYFTGRGV